MEEIKGNVIRKRRRGFFAILMACVLVLGALTVNAADKDVIGEDLLDNKPVYENDDIMNGSDFTLTLSYKDHNGVVVKEGPKNGAYGGSENKYRVLAVEGKVGGVKTRNTFDSYFVETRVKDGTKYTFSLQAADFYHYVSYWKDGKVLQCCIASEGIYEAEQFIGEIPNEANFVGWTDQDGNFYEGRDIDMGAAVLTKDMEFTATYKGGGADDLSLRAGSWTKGSKKPLKATLTSSDAEKNRALFNLFRDGGEVYVDGNLLSEQNGDYTAGSGSLIINLQPEFLNTLDTGTHDLKIKLGDGSEKPGTFKVNAKKDYYDDDDDDDDDDPVTVQVETVTTGKVTPKTGETDFFDDLLEIFGLSFR